MQIKSLKYGLVLTLLSLICFIPGYSQDSVIVKLHFKYGSKPKIGCHDIENKWFGGLHGGHVYIEIDGGLISFNPMGGVHILAHKKKYSSAFVAQSLHTIANDTVGNKFATFSIPVNNEQMEELKTIGLQYLEKTPYDYAFIGIRCASAAYDVFSQVGIFAEKSRSNLVISIFYPKMLRSQLYKQGYIAQLSPGRETRKWEKDKRKYRGLTIPY